MSPATAVSPVRGGHARDPLFPARAVQIDILDGLAAAEPIWRELESCGALMTPYQRLDWLQAWQDHVGARTGVRPFIVVGRGPGGSPEFVWPLGLNMAGPLTVAKFLGGKHANFNLGLWRRDCALAMTAESMQAICASLAECAPRLDTLYLLNQPETWDGVRNPFSLLPHQSSPSSGYKGALGRDFEAFFQAHTSAQRRSKMRRKERLLSQHGKLRYWRAITSAEAREIIAAFYEQKTQRMLERGLSGVFAEPGVREFITAAATEKIEEGAQAIELYAMSVGESIVATFGGAVAGGRFSAMFNSIVSNELARESPGEHLLVNLVRMCCERGLHTFDLGVGEAEYKKLTCELPEPLFDSLIGLTPVGRLACAAARLGLDAKRRIKSTPTLWSAAQTLRRRLARSAR